jgi:hypothetical protein
VARKFGKRGNPGAGGDAEDPRSMFGPPQVPRSAPPASSSPLADYLEHGWPGVDSGYVVLPRSLAESMSLPWQQQLVNQLAQFHDAHSRLAWPIYRVVPSRPERLVDLDEEQLAEAGYLVEMDTEGEMVYRERSGRKVEDPGNTTVLVSCLDPIPHPTGRPPAGQARHVPNAGAPAPMNIGPAPVWRTVTSPAQQAPPPFGPPPATASPAAAPSQPVQPPLPQSGLPQPGSPQPSPLAQPPQSAQPGSSQSAQPGLPHPSQPVQPPLPQPSQSVQPPLPQPGSPQPSPLAQPPQSASQPLPQPSQPVQPPLPQPSQSSQPVRPGLPQPSWSAQPPQPGSPQPPQSVQPAFPPLPQPSAAPSPQPGEGATRDASPDPSPRTPPGGAPAERGWFDQLAEGPRPPESDEAEDVPEFGPTGEPTEIPYRYRR